MEVRKKLNAGIYKGESLRERGRETKVVAQAAETMNQFHSAADILHERSNKSVTGLWILETASRPNGITI